MDALIKVCIEEISDKEWASSGFLCQDDCESVLTAMIRQDWAFLCLQQKSAQLILRRFGSIGTDKNKSKRRERHDIKRWEKTNGRRVDQMVQMNMNPNNWWENQEMEASEWE